MLNIVDVWQLYTIIVIKGGKFSVYLFKINSAVIWNINGYMFKQNKYVFIQYDIKYNRKHQ